MAGILRTLADNTRGGSLANSFRKRRFELFRSLLAPLARPVSILDVGGEENFWKQMGITEADGLDVTLINLEAPPVSLPFLHSISGDARDLSRFADKSFDVVFSNSVIEHVGSYDDQEKMAREILRVGKTYFVQTPAKWFPIEPHFLFPFFAILPDAVRVFLVRHCDLGWYKRIPDRKQAEEFLTGFQLLGEREMRRLFTGAEMRKERVLGLTKSYICIGGFEQPVIASGAKQSAPL